MKEFINLTLALVKKYREQWNYLYSFKLPGRRKFYLNSFIYAVPVYILLTSLWFFPLSILSGLFFGDSKALVETADGEYPTAFLLYPGVIFSFIFFWFRLQKIIEKEKKDLKAKKDAVIGYGGTIVECEPSTSSRESVFSEVIALNQNHLLLRYLKYM